MLWTDATFLNLLRPDKTCLNMLRSDKTCLGLLQPGKISLNREKRVMSWLILRAGRIKSFLLSQGPLIPFSLQDRNECSLKLILTIYMHVFHLSVFILIYWININFSTV